ncbi:MAG: GatB/YqeY domain-containing protein [Candidatus Moraniibacteriota bacterium]
MSIINTKIKEDLKAAMKAGDAKKRDVLRMLDSMFRNVEIEKGKRETGLSDEEIIEVLMRAVKQRKDSANQFIAGNRPELAESEQAEIDIISTYLPEQMGAEEILKVVKETMAELGAATSADMGKVMGAIMAKVKGQADGNLVKEMVQKEFEELK